MKALRVVLLIAASLLALFALLALVAPSSYHIEATAAIHAPRSVVLEQVSQFKHFAEWNPWSEQDPDMRQTLSGSDGQPGARYAWESRVLGSGHQVLTSVSPERVDMDLVFSEEWGSAEKTYFLLEEAGDSVKLSWALDMRMPPPTNVFGLLMGMRQAMEQDFRKGLGKLKQRCEQAQPPAAGIEIDSLGFSLRTYLVKRATLPFKEVSAFFANWFPKIAQRLEAEKLRPASPPSGLFYRWDEASQTTEMAAGMAVDGKAALDGLEAVPVEGPAIRARYYGPYEGSGAAHAALDEYAARRGLPPARFMIEEYITDPAAEPDSSKWLTYVYYVLPSPAALPR